MKVKAAYIKGIIGAIAIFGICPSVVEAIPQPSRRACIVSTAEEMGVPVANVKILRVGTVSAESGAATVVLENTRTGRTANCRVSTIDNSVLSVTLNKGNSPNNSGISNSGQNPEFFIVTASRTFLKATPGIFSSTVNNDITKNTILRNLGCQRKELPTWCQVEVQDNPEIKGWAFSPNFKEYRASKPKPEPYQQAAPEAGTPVSGLSDLIDAKAGQAENTVVKRGYKFLKGAGDGYTYWRETRTGFCVSVRTENGRYASFVYAPAIDCQ